MPVYRSAIGKLEKWKDNPRRKPLIVWGARQVGKTYLIKDIFAETYYANKYLYIDFRIEKEICDYCEKHVSAKEITEFISAVKGKKIDSNTLLLFDEIQECPAIITSLKYFCQDMPEIPVIATGSMVSVFGMSVNDVWCIQTITFSIFSCWVIRYIPGFRWVL